MERVRYFELENRILYCKNAFMSQSSIYNDNINYCLWSFLSLNSQPMSSFKTNPNAIIKIYFISYYRFCLILSNSDTSKGIKTN